MHSDKDLQTTTPVGVRPDDPRAHGNRQDGPLDGSTSGTIGGGGPETGGPTSRQPGPEFPPVKPGDAASGRLAPDPVDAMNEPDEMSPGPSDVNGG